MKPRAPGIGFAVLTGLTALAVSVSGLLGTGLASANSVYQTLPFGQNWTNSSLITVNDDWSGVPGIIGYDGMDPAVSQAGIDPRTVLTDTTTSNVSVSANRHHPSTITDVPVAEFHPGGELAYPVVGLRASTEHDAPFLLFHINTTGHSNIRVGYQLIDLDSSGRNTTTPVALQYRLGSSGPFTNVDAGFVADATRGPYLRGHVTRVSAELPAPANNKPEVQFRILTTNAVGPDEWIGIRYINVTSSTSGPPAEGVEPMNRIFLPLLQH
jgi:uncharacterized protein